MPEKFYFGYDTQDLLLACLCRHPQKFAVAGPLIRPEYMWGLDATRLMGFLKEYFTEFNHFPTFEGLTVYVQELCGEEKQELFNDVVTYITKLRKVTTRDSDMMAKITIKFCRERALIAAITKGAELIKAGQIPAEGLGPMMDKARAVGEDVTNLGVCYWEDVHTVVTKLTAKTWGVKTGFGLLDKQWRNGWGPGWLIVPLAPPKGYKCFGKGTGILMFDGSVKPVEEVKVGDLVMGDDSTPRKVLTAGSGNGPLYRVKQASGDDFVCNDAHMLCVKNLRGEIKEITAEEYSAKVPWFKRNWKGYKAAVEFQRQSVPLDPYFLGLWLGDGSTNHAEITVADCDQEIAQWLESKRIPDRYRFNDRETRLKLLAGLIDSDGSLPKKGRMAFVNANQQLAEDVCWLARSLGLLTSIARYKSSIRSTGYVGWAWHVTFSGNLAEIPTLVARKSGRNAIRKKGSRYKIEVNPIGTGEYYGFTVDGNNRFLLADFTVTHNSTFAMNLALNMTSKEVNHDPVPVFYYACEISAELSCARGYCMQSGQKFDDMYNNPERFIATTEEAMERDFDGPDGGQLLVKTFPSKSATINDIRLHAKMAREAFGIQPKAMFIDHAETVLPGERVKGSSDHRQQADIYTEARALGDEFQCPIIMPDRCNKETVQYPVPSMTSFQGSFQKAGEVDVAIGLCQTPEERLANQMRYFIFLNRHGRAYGYFSGDINDETFEMTLDTELAFEDEIEKAKEAEAARGNRSGNRSGKRGKSGAFERAMHSEREK